MELLFLKHLVDDLNTVSVFLDASKDRYIGVIPPKRYNIGVDIEEIDALEAQTGLTFPAVYREYLFLMGKSNYLDIELTRIDSYWDDFNRLKLELSNIGVECPPDLIPVQVRGDCGYYILASEGDNPVMYSIFFRDMDDEEDNPVTDSILFEGYIRKDITFECYLTRSMKSVKSLMEWRIENLRQASEPIKKGGVTAFLKGIFKRIFHK